MANTFKIGGVHPEPNKLSAGSRIVNAPLPKQAVFPLSQHIGAPAVPCVRKGDTVLVGTRIADAGGFMSAPIHSSVSGKVAKIDTVLDASGLRKPAIFIDVEGDSWEPGIDRTDTLSLLCSLTQQEILDCIRDAGVVGMGGACFPTHVKLSPPKDCRIDVLIVNAV
ncbi:MAG: electron transporter RnfC, partial [Spirochaetia bacterium]|nr:electron transporter RnfC [Spirochaetia bacterium]